MSEFAEINDKIDLAVRSIAPTITASFRQSISASGLRRVSGKSARGFTYNIRRDAATKEVWGISFTTQRYIYMHHHGMPSKSVRRGENVYNHRGYPERGLLTAPAEYGAKILADEISRVAADGFVTAIRF